MATLILPSKLKPFSVSEEDPSSVLRRATRRSRKNQSISMAPVARLFGPAIFEASKLRVLFLGVDGKKHPGHLPRTYTLTHSDITAKLTLAVSETINNSQLQGWYNRLQRDEVVAEWKKIKGRMSLHVHCHISGGHILLDLVARLRYYIFSKELPVVIKAFVHGDWDLLQSYPDLQGALVWVYFHSNIPEFNKVECWGPLSEASVSAPKGRLDGEIFAFKDVLDAPRACSADCNCCFPAMSSIPWPQNLHTGIDATEGA